MKRMGRLYALVLAGALFTAGPGAAQDTSNDLFIITDVRASRTCTPDGASHRAFSEATALATDAANCVSIDGIWTGARFYEDLDGYYRVGSSEPPPWEGAPAVMGVYGLQWNDETPSDRARPSPPERPVQARLTGHIGLCENLGGAGVVHVSGYCHSFLGPYIALGHATMSGPAIERRTGPAERARLGLLRPADPSSTMLLEAERRAFEWLQFLRADDPAAYAAAYDLNDVLGDIGEPMSELHRLFLAEGSVFSRLARQDGAELVLWRLPDDPDALGAGPPDPTDYAFLACFKIGSWTDDRWPVGRVDADNADDRPYACIDLWHQTIEDSVESGLKVPQPWGAGLAEPPWPD